MSGLLRRIRGARAASSEPEAQDGPALAEPVDAPDTEEQPTHDAAGTELVPTSDLDELVGTAPTTRRRGRLRRRLRHLRRVREVLLRDLGGFVFEVHRVGDGTDQGAGVVAAKLARMAAVDAEIRELEQILEDSRRETILREPGIGGTCLNCGELFGSDARFCWSCGHPVQPGAERPAEAMPAAPEARGRLQAWTDSSAPEDAAVVDAEVVEQPSAGLWDSAAEEPGAEDPVVEEAPAEEPAAEEPPAEPAVDPVEEEPGAEVPAPAEERPAPVDTSPEDWLPRTETDAPPTVEPGDPLATRRDE